MTTIPLVLPEEKLRKTQCLSCIERRLRGRPGIRDVLVSNEDGGSVLRLDYDPKVVTLAALEREIKNAEGCLDPNLAHVMLKVKGMHSVDAERAIERQLFGLPGVTASASYLSGTLRLEFDRRKCPLPEIVRRLDRLGYRTESGASGEESGLRLTRRPTLATKLALARQWAQGHVELMLVLMGGVLLVAGWLVGMLADPAAGFWDPWNVARVGLVVLSAVCTSTETFPEALGFLRRFRLDVDVLMFAAAIGAAALGHWEEGALLLFLFGLGSAGEHLALTRARASIEALTRLAPETAIVLGENGEQRVVGVKEVGEGDQVLVKPFERVPVDGVVEQGTSSVDQSAMTGESVPVEKGIGSEVFAGTMNTNGRLVVRCTKPASKSTLARIIQLVEEAQSTKSRTQVFTDKVEQYYVPLVFVATAGLIVVPPLIGWVGWGVGFYRAMAFLTAASPCALAIGTPAAVLCAIARAARIGVLIKGGVHLEALGTVKAVALDKTGTLTTGKLRVTDVIGFGGADEAEVLRVAGAVEAASTHPLAVAVVAEAKKRAIELPHAEHVEQIPAAGVKGELAGRQVFAGKASMLKGDESYQAAVGRLKGEGKALVAVGVDGVAIGVVALGDTPRPKAQEAVTDLRRAGVLHAAMLTGDHEGSAKAVAAMTGVDGYHADLLPEDKLRLIEEMAGKYGPVAMVGDGVNDAPALAKAAVGIAMGGTGAGGGGGASDVALETADVVLLSDDISKLPRAIELGRKARAIVTQNLVIALGVIAVVAPLSAMGFTRLSVAVLLHEGSTIVVVLNSLRLLRGRSR